MTTNNILQVSAAPGARFQITTLNAGTIDFIVNSQGFLRAGNVPAGTLLQIPCNGLGSFEAMVVATGTGEFALQATPDNTNMTWTVPTAYTNLLVNDAGSIGPPTTGLVWWFNAQSVQVYSDFAGTTRATAPYGRVARVDQDSPAPAGQWRTANETTLRAWKDSQAIDLQYGPTTQFAQPAALSVTANNCTLAVCWQQRTSNSQTNMIYFGDDAVSNWGIFCGSSQITIYAASTSFAFLAPVPPGAIVQLVIQYTATQVIATAVVNGTPYTQTFAGVNAGNATRNVLLGSGLGGVYHCQGGVSQLLAYSNTTVSVSALLDFLASTAPTGFPLDAPLVAVAGDSISQGVTATASLSEFYQAQFNLYGNATPPRMLNAGLSNLDLPGLIARYPTEIRPFVSARRLKNILCVQCMTNSMPCTLANAAATAAAVLTQLYAYCDQARADGWIVILYTCLPRSDASAGTGFPTAWNLVNTDIRANYALHAADLCDVAAVAGMSTIADAAGPNFSDQLHPSNAGQALVQVPTLAAITRRLAA